MSPLDFILDIYSNLLEQDWTMTDIDCMDIFGYFDVLIYRAKKNKKKEEKVYYINQIKW